MSQSIDDIRDECIADVDAMFAETVRFLPMKEGRADTGRQAMDVRGPLRSQGAKHLEIAGSTNRDALRSKVAGEGMMLRVSKRAYPDFSPQVDDVVEAKDRAGTPSFTIAAIDKHDKGRWKLRLNRR